MSSPRHTHYADWVVVNCGVSNVIIRRTRAGAAIGGLVGRCSGVSGRAWPVERRDRLHVEEGARDAGRRRRDGRRLRRQHAKRVREVEQAQRAILKWNESN